MYSLAIYIYMFCVKAAAFFNEKARLMTRGHRETWRKLRHEAAEGGFYWFHAASLGEFEQGRPLMERLKQEHPDSKILLTFFSPSGFEVRKNYSGADLICYLPFDTPTNARKFIRLTRPKAAFFIKYEFWRNYIDVLHHHNIPIYSVSSIFREKQIFFKWYGRNYARCLRRVTHFFVQNAHSRELLEDLGVTAVTVTGDTRFDRVISIHGNARQLPLIERFAGKSAVLVAGSTWPPDEDIIIDYFNARPKLKLVLAPHIVSESHLQEIESKLKRPSVRYGQADARTVENAECLIIDGYGLLSSIYRYATISYIGGGFGAGIHNVPEAAVYGCPVLFGPNNRKFREAQDLLKNGGAMEIETAEDFNKKMDKFLTDGDFTKNAGQAAGNYIRQNAGATEMIFSEIKF